MTTKQAQYDANAVDHRGRRIDWDLTADDYDRYRPNLPDALFDRLLARSWIRPSDRALDLGAGTGFMALGLASRRLSVTAIDRSPNLLEVLARSARDRQLDVRIHERLAEDTGEPDAAYDVVTLSCCWWWLDRDLALKEVERVLVPDGRVILIAFVYLPFADNVAARTEEIVRRYNPGWQAGGGTGLFPSWLTDLCSVGFREVESFSFDTDVSFTHVSWRGRMRACNGVAPSMTDADVQDFDRDLDAMLQQFPETLLIPHRVFVVSGLRPRRPR